MEKLGGGSHAFGQETDWRVGWFVGWIEKGDRHLSFVYMVQGNAADPSISSPLAKEQLKQRLLQLSL